MRIKSDNQDARNIRFYDQDEKECLKGCVCDLVITASAEPNSLIKANIQILTGFDIVADHVTVFAVNPINDQVQAIKKMEFENGDVWEASHLTHEQVAGSRKG